MPIGIVSDNDFDKELDNCRGVVKDSPKLGRPEGKKEVPKELRKIIGEEGAIGSRQEALAIADKFNISPSSVSAYSHGNTSTASYNEPDKDLSSFINNRKSVVAKKAQLKLLSALNRITTDKLDNVGPVALANVAKAMSAIVKDMEPETEREKGNSPTFVLYAPRMMKEESFEVIDVKE